MMPMCGLKQFVIHVKFLFLCVCVSLQAIKCRLANVTVPEGGWSPEAVLWVKEAVMGSKDCKMRVTELTPTRLLYGAPFGMYHKE